VIRLNFVPRSALVPGWWNTSKRGDEAVSELAPVLPVRPAVYSAAVGARAPLPHQQVAPQLPPPVRERHFRFTFKLVITSRIDDPRIADVPIYESPTLDVLDQWDGNSGRACADLEDMLQRLVRTPHRRVIVSGGYLQ
jgi:hypothetical protein